MHRCFKWIPLVLIVIVLISGLIFLIVNLKNGQKFPCNYLDSINISDGAMQPDSSIIFNSITYPKDQYFDINYVLRDGSKTHINVHSSYRRGCLCNIKPCIRLCCSAGVFYNNVKFKCQRYTNGSAKHLEHDVLDENNDTEHWTLNDHFVFVYDKPCQGMFIADDDYDITHVIKVYVYLCACAMTMCLLFSLNSQTGHVLFENRSRSHHEYCLAPIASNYTDGTHLELHACPTEDNAEILKMDILPYCKFAGIFDIYGSFVINHYAYVFFFW